MIPQESKFSWILYESEHIQTWITLGGSSIKQDENLTCQPHAAIHIFKKKKQKKRKEQKKKKKGEGEVESLNHLHPTP